MSNLIYEPKGKAREYSPLALNIYIGCGHKCSYCYVPKATFIDRDKFDNEVTAKKNVMAKLESSCRKWQNTDRQVLLSFSTDPYNRLNDQYKLTRIALTNLLKYQIPVAILTKGGLRVIQDMDVIKRFVKSIKVGASLTFDNEADSRKVEKDAALPDERLEMLKQLKEAGIRTWASLEPVIKPEQTLNLIELTKDFVDEYQVGRLNHFQTKIDWQNFGNTVVKLLRMHNKDFYIKEELAKECTVELNNSEIDINRLTVPKFEKESMLF